MTALKRTPFNVAAVYANKERRQSGLIVAIGVADPSPILYVELS
jgi:hypothetical protein